MDTLNPHDEQPDDTLARQREELLKHFQEWSGGFMPDECEDTDIDTYIQLARPAHIDAALARKLLTGIPFSASSASPTDQSEFTIHGEVDLDEKMTSDELGAELEHFVALAHEYPQARHAVREHPNGDHLLFILYSGPEVTDDNKDAFETALRKYLQD